MIRTNIIRCGDHLDLLPEYPDGFFDMFLTSPPYDDLRTYYGYDFQFEPLAHELYRVLKNGGVGVWIVNDTTKDFCESLTSFKQAIYFVENVGFNLNDTMIYNKKTSCFPVGYNHTKYGDSFEFMLCLAKGKPKTFNLIKDHVNSTKGAILCRRERQPNGDLTIAHGNGKTIKEYGARTNVWTYDIGFMSHSKDKEAFNHPAIFPEKLAEDHILSWSNPGDIILDPMCGSGTTCKMAIKHGRQYVGMDCSADYCDLSRTRLEHFTQQTTLFEILGQMQ